MREITFRAKSVYYKCFVYGLPIHYNRNPRTEKWAIRNEHGLEHDVSSETLGESSNLCDIDHHLIFEHDIVQCEDGTIYEVKFGEGAFYGRQKDKSSPHNYTLLSTLCERGCKVIGNIFDNKELLNKED